MMSRDVEPPFIQNERSRQASFLADISASDRGEIRFVSFAGGCRWGCAIFGPRQHRHTLPTQSIMWQPASRRAGVRRLRRELNAEMQESGRLAEQGSGNR
jgi:hypothetical protein